MKKRSTYLRSCGWIKVRGCTNLWWHPHFGEHHGYTEAAAYLCENGPDSPNAPQNVPA